MISKGAAVDRLADDVSQLVVGGIGPVELDLVDALRNCIWTFPEATGARRRGGRELGRAVAELAERTVGDAADVVRRGAS